MALRQFILSGILVLASSGMLLAQETVPPAAEAMPLDLDAGLAETEAAPARLWLGGELLLWWVRRGPVPGPMVTTSPLASAGRLGAPGTVILYGQGSDIDYMGHAGGRFDLGFWFDDAGTLGCEIEGLFLETHTLHFEINSDKAGVPVTARPFFNVLTGTEDAQVLTAPGNSFGGIDVFSDSRLWGAESNFLTSARRGAGGTLVLLAGFRYLGLDESLRISQSTTVLPGAAIRPSFRGAPVPDSFILSLTDRFETRNEFFGGQIGARGELRAGRWFLEGTAKIGLGATKQWVNNMGVTSLTGPDGPVDAVQAGLYAVGDNRGLHSRERLTLIAETGFRLGFQITPRWAVHFGYTFLYWGDVARPGEQMIRNLNPTFIPSDPAFGTAGGAPEPIRRFASSEFWAMGASLGLAFRY